MNLPIIFCHNNFLISKNILACWLWALRISFILFWREAHFGICHSLIKVYKCTWRWDNNAGQLCIERLCFYIGEFMLLLQCTTYQLSFPCFCKFYVGYVCEIGQTDFKCGSFLLKLPVLMQLVTMARPAIVSVCFAFIINPISCSIPMTIPIWMPIDIQPCRLQLYALFWHW